MTTTAIASSAGTYELDRAHSTVQFAVRHVGVSMFRASFGDLDARLTIDDRAAELEARATAESISIVEPPEFREHVVNGDDFFAAAAHPTITFRSTSVELGDDGSARVSGDLTIRGVSRPAAASGAFTPPIEDPFGRHRVGLELHGAVDRRAWGMDWQAALPGGGDALGWQVEISAHLEFTRTT